MNRETRKDNIRNQNRDSKWTNPFSEEAVMEFSENNHETSEARLLKIADPGKIPEAFRKATVAFARDHELETVTATTKDSIPDFEKDINFKYMIAVEDFQNWVDNGVETVAVFIKEQGKVIAFGIAHKEDSETEIDVIEVEMNSTRSAGLSEAIEVEHLSFEIGVGHLVVLRLLEACRPPIWTDATNDESRYIFKSLGFVHDNTSMNPCILRKDA